MWAMARWFVWPDGPRGVRMASRKNIQWADLPIERRRRLAVMLGELIRRRMAADRETVDESGKRRAGAS